MPNRKMTREELVSELNRMSELYHKACEDLKTEMEARVRNEIPRRNQMLSWVPAEKIIHEAVQEVEKMGADPLLTDAVVLLSQAKSKVADYVDKKL